jgi:hypothetical protein
MLVITKAFDANTTPPTDFKHNIDPETPLKPQGWSYGLMICT